MLGDKTIKKVGENVKVNLRQELRDQGHYLTGALDQSIADRYFQGDGATMVMEALDYISQVNEGIPASEIDLSDIRYLQGLADYAKKRFGARSEKQAFRIAFAIAKKHKKEGMPTLNSYQFSATGERKHAVEISYDTHKNQNEKIIEDGINTELDDLINKTFDVTIF